MNQQIKILLIEDSVDDAELLKHHLSKGNFPFIVERVETLEQLAHALKSTWDVVICDFNLTGFTAFDALSTLQQNSQDLPFIILSGALSEEIGVALMKAGAHDVVIKSRMGRLIPAIQREIKDAHLRRQNKELEQQLFHAQRMDGIGAITSGVAHDLNNLLSPILMASDILKSRALDPDAAHLFDIIYKNARHGADVVAQLLSFARKVDGKRIVLDLKHLIRDMARLAQQTFPPSITTKVALPPKLWSISGDATQLYQVLLNLVVNARDAMPTGGTLSIAAENFIVDESFAAMMPGSTQGPHIALSISDTGLGIPDEIMPKIFDPFFTTKSQTGNGLGLPTVLGIIKNHGGFIQVLSQLRVGSTFKVYLPANPDFDAPATAESPSALFGKNELVLVAEDQPDVRELAGKILSAHRYTVLLAPDGPTALVQLSRHLTEVRALITDIQLPFMDGLALIRAVQRMIPSIKIIATTGSEHRQKELADLSVPFFLRKPYTGDSLLHTLHQALYS